MRRELVPVRRRLQMALAARLLRSRQRVRGVRRGRRARWSEWRREVEDPSDGARRDVGGARDVASEAQAERQAAAGGRAGEDRPAREVSALDRLRLEVTWLIPLVDPSP